MKCVITGLETVRSYKGTPIAASVMKEATRRKNAFGGALSDHLVAIKNEFIMAVLDARYKRKHPTLWKIKKFLKRFSWT